MSVDDGSLDRPDRTLFIVEMPDGSWPLMTRSKAEAYTEFIRIKRAHHPTCSLGDSKRPRLLMIWVPEEMPHTPKIEEPYGLTGTIK